MGVYSIELLVRLKTADTTALTAKNTLQKDMGYDGTLLDLVRKEYWLIELEAGSVDEAEKLGREFVTATKTLVNPNKHTYNLRVLGESGEGTTRGNPHVIRALVSYREDEKAHVTRNILRDILGYGDRVKNVKRGTLWELTIKADDEAGAKQIAEEIVVARSIESGLLANPHSQTYSVL